MDEKKQAALDFAVKKVESLLQSAQNQNDLASAVKLLELYCKLKELV